MFADVVAGVEGLDDLGLLARMRSVEGRRRELEAEQAVVLAELDRRRLFQADGHASMWGLLRASLGWSNAECRSRMRVARLVTEFVSVGEALFETWIPVAHTAEIARGFANPRCGQQIDSVIGVLSLEASRLEFDDFRRLVERWELLADTDVRIVIVNQPIRTATPIAACGTAQAVWLPSGAISMASKTWRSSNGSSRPSSRLTGSQPRTSTASKPAKR